MKSIIALETYQKIIQQEPANRNFCKNELRWIENRKLDWGFDRIRVGVIGVTSSGKSTLINAILGADILSSAIAPSSGQLVCCSHGNKREIIIHFEDGSEKRLSGKQFSQDILQEFSDERFNPQNQKGVLSIELTSPLFDFGKDVLLVDSPGLDAFGLESHERLTLESLVPTIDSCIYVTTMKTNSDRKTLEILNTVAKYHCPIIIVQNMLDAVRPSPSGDKTSEQVAHDHKNRVKRIVDKSNIEDKASVQIIQISAELAKKWRVAKSVGKESPISENEYCKSNYNLFVESVTSILEVQRPRIERQRLLSVRASATDLLNIILQKINKPATIVEETFPFQNLKNQAEQRRKTIPEEYQKALEAYASAAKQIRIAIGAEKEGGTASVPKAEAFQGFLASFKNIITSSSTNRSLEECLADTNKVVNVFEDVLANLISNHNSFVTDASKVINIPSRDLLCSSSLHSFRGVTLQKKTEIRSRKVKKSGVLSGIARGLGALFGKGDWGYEIESYEEIVTDAEATKKKICDRLADAYDKYTKSMEEWASKNFERSMDLIEAEIAALEESYRRKKEAAIEMESLSKLNGALRSFIEQINTALPDSKFTQLKETSSAVFSSKKIEVSQYTGALLGLSRSAIQRQQRAITKAFVSKIGCQNYFPVIISWDDNSLDEFIWQTGISDAAMVRSPVCSTEIPQNRGRCLFILVNAIQYGAALKQIAALKLNSILTKQDHVVWVVQDFQELLTGDRAVEGLVQMTEITDALQISSKSSIFIMHQNPIYNLAFLKHQFDRSLRHTPHKLIDELQTNFGVYLTPTVLDTLGEIINKVCLR